MNDSNKNKIEKNVKPILRHLAVADWLQAWHYEMIMKFNFSYYYLN